MTSQRPTQFENYPLEPDPTASASGEGGPAPHVQPYLPPPVPRPAPVVRQLPESGTSRRTVVGMAIGVPLAAVLGISVLGRIGESGTAEAQASGMATEAPPYDGWESAEVGGHTTELADGWQVLEEDPERLVLGNGSNWLYAYPKLLSASTIAVEELPALVKQALDDVPGFRGVPGDAVDSSTLDVQKAGLGGTGTVKKHAARLLANLWVTSTGEGLLVVRILTAAPNSDAAYGGQAMTDQLSSDFG